MSEHEYTRIELSEAETGLPFELAWCHDCGCVVAHTPTHDLTNCDQGNEPSPTVPWGTIAIISSAVALVASIALCIRLVV